MSLRVLIADDQALVRTGFRKILESEPDIDVVGEAQDGGEAIEKTRLLRPDVVLMDIRMPRVDGIEATRRIAGNARVLILTTFDVNEYVYDALRAGASGFLLKDTQADQLVTGVRVVAQGESLLAPSITRRLIEQFACRPPPSAAARRARGADTSRARDPPVRRPRACRTPRSRPSSSSAKRPSRLTSRASCASSSCEIGSRPWSSPTKRAWSSPAAAENLLRET